MVLEDRERIARDLHDVVIQRLFATGLQLQSAAPLIARPEVAKRVNAAVDDLDATIRDIRRPSSSCARPMSAGAAHRDPRGGRGRRRVARLPARAWSCPGRWTAPCRTTSGPTSLAVLREALSNVVRHAQRRPRRRCAVRVDGGRLTVTVTDDGVGCDPATRPAAAWSTCANAPSGLGGDFAVRPAEPRGTECAGRVPLRELIARRWVRCVLPSSRVASTAAWVRRSRPSLASRLET